MLLGRTVAPGEPLFTPEDRADLATLWEDRRARCASCNTRVTDWFDPVTGKELRDPIAEAAVFRCPGCELIEEHDKERKDRRPGERTYLSYYSDASGPDDPNTDEVSG